MKGAQTLRLRTILALEKMLSERTGKASRLMPRDLFANAVEILVSLSTCYMAEARAWN